MNMLSTHFFYLLCFHYLCAIPPQQTRHLEAKTMTLGSSVTLVDTVTYKGLTAGKDLCGKREPLWIRQVVSRLA